MSPLQKLLTPTRAVVVSCVVKVQQGPPDKHRVLEVDAAGLLSGAQELRFSQAVAAQNLSDDGAGTIHVVSALLHYPILGPTPPLREGSELSYGYFVGGVYFGLA